MEKDADAVTTLLAVSARGTSRLAVVMLAGFIASKFPKDEPLLARESCRIASRIYTRLFQPAFMVASLGSTLTLSSLRDSWQVAVAASLTIFVSFATSELFGRAFLRPQARREFVPVQLAIAFPNAGAFPLLLMESLCQQEAINIDYDGDSEECFRSATSIIFIYLVVFQFIFFSWGFHALGNNNALELNISRQSTDLGGSTGVVEESFKTKRGDGLTQANVDVVSNSVQNTEEYNKIPIDTRDGSMALMPAVEEGCLVAYDNYQQDKNIQQRKDQMSGSQEVVPSIPGTTKEGSPLLMKQVVIPTTYAPKKNGAYPSETFDTRGIERICDSPIREGKWAAKGHLLLRALSSPNIIAIAIAIVISAIPPLQEMLFGNPQAALWPLGAALQTLGTPTVTLSTVVMAASLMQVPKVSLENQDAIWSGQRLMMGALHVVCRLIAFPLFGFIAFWMARNTSLVMGSNRLMCLVLLIEFSVPSASLNIVSLNQLRMPATAGFMARLYIVQYFISMFTISAWIAIALNMLY